MKKFLKYVKFWSWKPEPGAPTVRGIQVKIPWSKVFRKKKKKKVDDTD